MIQQEEKYKIKIEDLVDASIENLDGGYLQRQYVKKLFSNIEGLMIGVVARFEYPKNTSAELVAKLSVLKDHCRKLRVGKRSSKDGLSDYYAFSLLFSDTYNFDELIDLLALAWTVYDSTDIFFLTSKADIELFEHKIVESKKSVYKIVDNVFIDSYLCYYKGLIEENIIFLSNRSSCSFEQILNPDPALYIASLMQERILYRIEYVPEVVRGRDFVDSILVELGLSKLFENAFFSINENSSEQLLIMDLKSPHSIGMQLVIEDDMIYFNIDRVFYPNIIYYNKPDAYQQLKEKLRLFLFSKTRVEYRGDMLNTRVCFLDNGNNVVYKFSADFSRLLNLLAKPNVFEYEPIFDATNKC